jgi:hypothetical protein
MSLEIFARSSLAQFCLLYTDLFTGEPIQPTELEALMWGRMCAKDAGISKTGFKIPYDNIKRAKVTLPYMPYDINYTGCAAIKKNGGLYTPCCGKIAEDTYYCKSCSVDKDGEAKELQFGDIESREFNVENEQFAPITFAEWMKAQKTSLPEVYAKLRDAGIALEIPAAELTCRELPKRRKGRPAKSDDSVVDEDSVPKGKAKAKSAASDDDAPKAKKAKAKSPAASDDDAPKAKKAKAKSPAASDDDAPKAKKAKAKAKAESESESEVEAPKKGKTKAKAAASEDEAPKSKKASKKADAPKAKKASKAEESDDEKPAKKASKAKSTSGDEKPTKASKKAEAPKAKASKAKSPPTSGDEKPKKKASKSSGSESDTPKAKAKAKIPEPEPEPEEEEEEEEEVIEQEIEIMGEDGKMHDYMLRSGKFICDMEDGRILGTVNEDGEPEWSDDA